MPVGIKCGAAAWVMGLDGRSRLTRPKIQLRAPCSNKAVRYCPAARAWLCESHATYCEQVLAPTGDRRVLEFRR